MLNSASKTYRDNGNIVYEYTRVLHNDKDAACYMLVANSTNKVVSVRIHESMMNYAADKAKLIKDPKLGITYVHIEFERKDTRRKVVLTVN